MPNISCSAHTCAHNAKGFCEMSNVKIDTGSNRNTDAKVFCESFETKNGGTSCGCKNSCACESVCVDCGANDCVHNSSGHCRADSITVEGHNAHCCSDTSCETYNSESK